MLLKAIDKQLAAYKSDIRSDYYQLVLHYHPKICLKSGSLVGFEALIRRNHPQLGMMPPNDFISLAEESGLILPLGEWVMRTACRQVAQWYREGLSAGVMAVNVSARHFQESNGWVAAYNAAQ